MKIVRFLFIAFAFVLFVAPVFATSGVDTRIEELKAKISQLQREENTLSKQISLLDSNIALTTLKITNIKDAITKLSGEIDELATEIERIEVLLTKRSELVLRRIPATYKRQVAPQFGVLLFSQNFSDFLTRMKYLAIVQEQDAQLLFQLKATQNHFGERKALREEKRATQQQLQKQLEQENNKLLAQKREKQTLLAETKNSEVIYQKLLAQALAEQGAIKSAISEALKLLKRGEGNSVSAGDTIALVGNSGAPDCSTGAHLHFSILKDDVVQNPANYLRNTSIAWENQPDGPFSFSGDWDWPISSPRITQGFGMTYWARLGWYGGNIHDGIDIASQDPIIKAPRSGRIIRGATSCDNPRIAGVSTLKYAAIAHDDGVVTIYLHVQ